MNWPSYREYINQIALHHKTLWILALTIFGVFVLNLLPVNLSFNQIYYLLIKYITCSSYFIRDSLGTLNCLWQFPRDYLSLIWKDSVPFACGPSLKNSDDSYLCFPMASRHSVPFSLFPLLISPFLCAQFLMLLYYMGKVLLIKQHAD